MPDLPLSFVPTFRQYLHDGVLPVKAVMAALLDWNERVLAMFEGSGLGRIHEKDVLSKCTSASFAITRSAHRDYRRAVLSALRVPAGACRPDWL